MQDATGGLMAATSEQDVAARVLPPMASMVGAQGIAIEATDGTRIGAYGDVDDDTATSRRWEFPFGRLDRPDERLRSVLRRRGTEAAAGAGLADRARARPGAALRAGARRPRDAGAGRPAQESVRRPGRARAPVAGQRDLRAVGDDRRARDQLAPEQLEELQSSLTMQIRRLRELVEQLLDLSRLDADAVVIRPQPVRVRDRLEEIVDAVSPLRAGKDRARGRPSLEAELDVDALDRIVSNLIVNACRYGEPPVLVSAATEGGLATRDGPGQRARVFPRSSCRSSSTASPPRRGAPRAPAPALASRSPARTRGRTAARSATALRPPAAPRSSWSCRRPRRRSRPDRYGVTRRTSPEFTTKGLNLAASKRQTTFAKMAREQAMREKRVRKQEKKDDKKQAAIDAANGVVTPVEEPVEEETPS